MKRLLLTGPRELELQEVAEPVAGPSEVVVRVSACGICGSDVHSYTGAHPLVIYPVVQGHEFSGTVDSVGAGVSRELLGARVVVEPSLACGACPQCASGRYNICGGLRVMGFQAPGAMAELVAVPADRLHRLPERVDLLEAALVEPCAVAVHAFDRSGVRPHGTVLVIGAGVIGTMVIHVAKSAGCRVVCVERDDDRLVAAKAAGADTCVKAGEGARGEITAGTDGETDAVFECVGAAATLDLAIAAAQRGSTVVVVGVFSEPVPVQAALIQDGELEVKGTLMYTGEDFRKAIDLVAGGMLDATRLISAKVPLEEVAGAYELILDPARSVMKVIVEPGG